MKTLREVLASIHEATRKDPSLLDLPCVSVDDQCAHTVLSGNVFREGVEDWPDEYCIEDALPPGATEFVRIC